MYRALGGGPARTVPCSRGTSLSGRSQNVHARDNWLAIFQGKEHYIPFIIGASLSEPHSSKYYTEIPACSLACSLAKSFYL